MFSVGYVTPPLSSISFIFMYFSVKDNKKQNAQKLHGDLTVTNCSGKVTKSSLTKRSLLQINR